MIEEEHNNNNNNNPDHNRNDVEWNKLEQTAS
jgi:hypothetical protein